MNRFGSPDDGEKKQFPWESPIGDDTPELNENLPQFIRQEFQTRRRVKRVLSIVEGELEFLATVDLSPFLAKRLSSRLEECTKLSNKRLNPDASVRPELLNDLVFLDSLPHVLRDYLKWSGTLYESYLWGRYRPDPDSRGRLQSLIKERTNGIRDIDESRRAFPFDEFADYMRDIGFRTAREQDKTTE